MAAIGLFVIGRGRSDQIVVRLFQREKVRASQLKRKGSNINMKMSDLAKKVSVTILIISSICVVGSVIYYRSIKFLSFLLGALLGSAVSIAKIFMLERSVDKTLKMDKKSAGGYVIVQYFLRLLLTGAVLVLGAVVPQINLWGVVAGVFAYPVSLYIARIAFRI